MHHEALKLRILIDTNIFIDSESNQIIRSDLANLQATCSENNVIILVHPASKNDIKRDLVKPRKEIHKSKFDKYPVLEDPGEPSSEFISIIGEPKREQDIVDNKLLYAIYKNAVDYLVTEDKGIHTKANKLDLKDRVLTIEQAEEKITATFEKYIPIPVSLEHIPIYKLDLQSEFFNTLREDYGSEFNEWFTTKCKEGRMCWCYRQNEDLKALLIYDERKKQILRDHDEKVLKMCTFKVSEEVRGSKIGELLLKMCFDFCNKNGLATAYVTLFPEKTFLIELLEEFGFEFVSKEPNGELKYLKDFLAPGSLDDLHPWVYCKKYYPNFFDGARVRKFIIPIQPQFHNRLFADAKKEQLFIDEFEPIIVEQNTIKKAYICKSSITRIRPGDILLFYRSQIDQGITGIGIAEKVLRHPSKFDELTEFIGSRSVYSMKELKELYGDNALAILYRYIGQLPSLILKDSLLELETIKGPPQSIQELDHRLYKKLKETITKWPI